MAKEGSATENARRKLNLHHQPSCSGLNLRWRRPGWGMNTFWSCCANSERVPSHLIFPVRPLNVIRVLEQTRCVHGQRIDAALKTMRVVTDPRICSSGCAPAMMKSPRFSNGTKLSALMVKDTQTFEYKLFSRSQCVEHGVRLGRSSLRLGTYPQKKQEAQRQNRTQKGNF